MGAGITPKGTGLYDLYNVWVMFADLFKQYRNAPSSPAPAPASMPSGNLGQNTQMVQPSSQYPTYTIDPCANVPDPGAFSSDQYIYNLAKCCAGRKTPGATCVAFARSWEAAKTLLPDGYNLGDLNYIDEQVAGIMANASVSASTLGTNALMDAKVKALMRAKIGVVLAEMYPQSSSAQKLRLGSLTTKPVTQTPTIRLGNLSTPSTPTPKTPVLPNLSGIMKYFKPNQTPAVATRTIQFKTVK
jgi:hypothetical protein